MLRMCVTDLDFGLPFFLGGGGEIFIHLKEEEERSQKWVLMLRVARFIQQGFS